jgi:hypothetical protein
VQSNGITFEPATTAQNICALFWGNCCKLLIYSGKDLPLSQQPHRELPQCYEPNQAKRKYRSRLMPPHEPLFKPAARLLNSIRHHLPHVPNHRIPAFALNPDAVTGQAHDAHGSASVSDGHGIALAQCLPP